jgi:hypothetical protein
LTAQAPESLIIDGESWLLLATPLGSLLTHPVVAPHTALGRGYSGSWRLEGNDLYLDDVRGWIADAQHGAVEVGPDVLLRGWKLPAHATWLSGDLRIATGDQLVHVHSGFASEWEYEGTLHVERGVVTGRDIPARATPAPGPSDVSDPVGDRPIDGDVVPEVRPPATDLHPDGRARMPWCCMYCGWRCEQSFNDYACHACGQKRPWIGGSMTMRECASCRHWVPAFAKFCEWCGGRLSPIEY